MVEATFRSKKEEQRGIARNEKGQIIWTKAQLDARKAHYTGKLSDYATRTKNAKAEIKRIDKLIEDKYYRKG